MFHIHLNLSVEHYSNWCPFVFVLHVGRFIHYFIYLSHSIRPEVYHRTSTPSAIRMDHHRPCKVLKQPDPPLCSSIGVVGIDPGKGKALMFQPAVGYPLACLEDTIISMISSHLHSLLSTVFFERIFSFQSLFGDASLLKMYVRPPGIVVNIYCCKLKLILGWSSNHLCYQTWGWRYHLIN